VVSVETGSIKFELTLVRTMKSGNLDQEWIDRGTQDWEDFGSFVFLPAGIGILFAPYQVACYADGPQFVEIPYERIKLFMRNEYVSALGIR